MKLTEAASQFNIVIFKEILPFLLSVTIKDALTVTLKKSIYNTKIQNKHPAIHKSKSRCGERLPNENVSEEAFSVLFQSLKCAFEITGQQVYT